MNAKQLVKQAQQNPQQPVWAGEAVVIIANSDGTISVTDNGEEVVCNSADEAVEVVKENLGQ
ncbi:hypothetical protein Rctr71_034 [Virus Rctr71]|nr:hypothetical protein Rctr71_034 [Virus Rctr71]